MEHVIKIAARNEFHSVDLWEMHQLRTNVFRDRKGWEVSVQGGLEIDNFDSLAPYYMMVREPSRVLVGGMRLLPTQGSYMLKDIFPALLHGLPAPEDSAIWEISRFAINAKSSQGFGFSELILKALRELVSFGDQMGIKYYVMVTTSSIERMMRRADLAITRFGPPIRIGVEVAVALTFDLSEQTREALFGKRQEAA